MTTVNYLNGPGIDNKLRQSVGVAALYFVQDHLGSTRALTDGNGNVVEQQQFDSFGNSAGSNLTRYGFTGRERDPDTGMLYYRARFYEPQLGRFISEDPIALQAGLNLYEYTRNNPVNFRDPMGTSPLGFIMSPVSRLFPSGKKSNCDDCAKDVALIMATFRAAMDQMNSGGHRSGFAPWNGIQGTLSLITGGTPYWSCYEQAVFVQSALRRNQYDNPWSFDIEGLPPISGYSLHTWVRARSSNPKCPSIKLDPWLGTTGEAPTVLL